MTIYLNFLRKVFNFPSSILLCLGIVLTINVHAATVNYNSLEYHGGKIISKQTFETYLPVKLPATLNDEAIGHIIRNLYKTGFFKQIKVSRKADKLIFSVVENPTIGKITTEGNSLIADEQLNLVYEQADLVESKFLNELNFEQMLLAMIKNYHNEGYYNAKLDYEIIPKEFNKVDIKVNIDEGSQSTIDKIQITGNKSYSLEKLQSLFLLTEATVAAAFSNSNYYSKFKLESDLESLRSHYFNNGFARFTIDSSQVTLSPNKEKIYLSINLTEGEQYTIGNIDISGKLVVPKDVLLNAIKAKEGEVFNRSKIINSLNKLREKLGDDGYAFAEVFPNQLIDDDNRTVSFNFIIKPKNQVYVNRIIIKNNLSTNDEVIRRMMLQLEGSTYSISKVNQSKTKIERLGFFERVQITTEKLSPYLLNLIVSVDEQPTGSLEASIGYTQSIGISYKFGVNEKNTLGTGWPSKIELESSSSRQTLNLSATNPYVNNREHSLTTGLFYSAVDTEDLSITSYSSNQKGINISYGIPVAAQVRFNIGTTFTETDLTCGSDSTLCNEFVEEFGELNSNTELFVRLKVDNRNKGVFPTRGNRFISSLSSTLPSDNIKFYKLSLDNDYYKSLLEKLTFSFRTDLSYGDSLDDNSGLPFYEKYFTGGPYSVRGFSTSTLGEHLDTNNSTTIPKGGDFKTVFNFELITPPPWDSDISNMRTLVFIDIGSVFSDVDDWNSDRLASAYGIGINWLTPVGPISLAWSKIYKKGYVHETGQSFQFAIGGSF